MEASMPLKPPVPEPDGFLYCFGCEQMLPVASFYFGRGRPSKPCKACKKSGGGARARLNALVNELYEEMQANRAARPARPAPIVPEYAPMGGMALWAEREEAKRRRKGR